MLAKYDIPELAIEPASLLRLLPLPHLFQRVSEDLSVSFLQVVTPFPHQPTNLGASLLWMTSLPAEFGHHLDRIVEAFEAHRTGKAEVADSLTGDATLGEKTVAGNVPTGGLLTPPLPEEIGSEVEGRVGGGTVGGLSESPATPSEVESEFGFGDGAD
jgi:hypothetical protein